MRLSLIAAIGKNKEIGYQGALPWKLRTDMAHFKSLTTNHTVIMGRKTHESIRKPLPNRANIILTKDQKYTPLGCLVANSFDTALGLVSPRESESFVIGGAEIFAVALLYVTRMYITQVDYSGPADTYFPNFDPDNWKTVFEDSHLASPTDQYSFKFSIYERKISLKRLNISRYH